MKSALSPIAIFDEMMMNQTNALIQPSVRRSRVRAKLVLDQIAATSEKVPAKLITFNIFRKFGYLFNGRSQI